MVLLVAVVAGPVVALIALWAAVADRQLRVALTVVVAAGAVVAFGLAFGLRGVVGTESVAGPGSRVEVAEDAPAGDGHPSYDDTRVAIGLAAAGGCLLVALGLWRRTDWTATGGDPFAGVEVPSDPFGDPSAPSSDRLSED